MVYRPMASLSLELAGEVQGMMSSYSRITCSTITLTTLSQTAVIFGARPTSQLQLASLGSIRKGVGAPTFRQSPAAAVLLLILSWITDFISAAVARFLASTSAPVLLAGGRSLVVIVWRYFFHRCSFLRAKVPV